MISTKYFHEQAIAFFRAKNFEKANIIINTVIDNSDITPSMLADFGVIKRAAGELIVARNYLSRAVEKVPENADFLYNLALVCGDLYEIEEAEKYYEMALLINPGMPAALNNLGNIKKATHNILDARRCYEEAIKHQPEYFQAHKNLADLMEASGFDKMAISSFTRAIHIKPQPGSVIRKALTLPLIFNSKEEIFDSRERLKIELDRLKNDEKLSLEDPVIEVGSTNFSLAYHGLKDLSLQKEISSLYQKICPSLNFRAPHIDDWMPGLEGGAPRVGFISSFFHEHTITKLNINLINGLPKSRIEVVIFSFSNIKDLWSEKIRKSEHKFVPLNKNLDLARKQISEEMLDILYFTDIGMEPLTYFLAFSRIAPIQCVTWGHPVTTGISNIDYFISSSLAEPKNADLEYSEKLLSIDGMLNCVTKPIQYRNVSRVKKSHEIKIVCPQSLFKFHPDIDPLIGGILRAVPNAKVHIIDGLNPYWSFLLKKRLLKSLSDVSDRVQVLPRMDNNGYSQLMQSADVVLDTPHFSGGLTSLEAFAASTPIVTIPGKFMRGRVTLAMYRQMGILDCVAKDRKEYVDIAARLCLDQNFHEVVSSKIREGHDRIFDNRKTIGKHARIFEKAMFES